MERSTGRPYSRWAAALGLALACALLFSAGLTAATHGAPLPADLEALITKDPHDGKAIEAMILAKLHQHLCEPMPDLSLRARKGDTISLRKKFRGKRAALFFPAADCTACIDWCNRLNASSWRPPSGYDTLITLIITPAMGNLTKCLVDKPDVYLTGFPLHGFLSYANMYPMMFFMSRDGSFEGFQKLNGERIMQEGGCHEKRKQ